MGGSADRHLRIRSKTAPRAEVHTGGMNNTHKLPRSPSPDALFRYLVLGQVESLVCSGWSSAKAVRAVAERDHVRLDGIIRTVSARTIRRWRRDFADTGMAALTPAVRTRTETSVVLPDDLVEFLRSERAIDLRASVPELIRRARERGVIPVDLPVDRTTAWRCFRRMGLSTRHRPSKREADTRRFSYPHRMQCVLCDGKHFRAGAARLRRVALFFLDDATRYALHAIVGTSESTKLFLNGLYNLVEYYGLMALLFIDGGPGFISDDTATVVSVGLGAWLAHGRAKYPEGHGKIERFNRTALAAVLRSFDGAAQVDPACVPLDLRLRHFLHIYNNTPHESLGGDTPRQRWEADRQVLRFPEDLEDLRRRFVIVETRKVSNDHVIRHSGLLWEAPRGLARATVEVHRNALNDELFVRHRGRMIQLHELDPHANAIAQRGRPGYPDDDRPVGGEGVPTTAATMAFQRDFGPLVGPDGGFIDPTTKE